MTAARAFVEVARTAAVLASAPDPLEWLSASEQARLATLRHAGRREHYLAGHWLARALLAREIGEQAWSLVERRSLPPQVAGHEAALVVSLSHSGAWVAAAVADAPIGIDLEQRGRVLDASLEPLLLEPGEVAQRLDAAAMLQRWVAKEAWLKRGALAALPAQLSRLRLRAAPPAQADVLVRTHADFHLGVASMPGCQVAHRSDGPAEDTVGFVVSAQD